MKAVLLIGGLGTRLRPLTLTTPKPLLSMVGAPFIRHQMRLLRRHGIKEAILCTAYKAESFRHALPQTCEDVRIRFVNERTPLGTAGALRNARRFLTGSTFVLNGDLLHDLDITAFSRRHRESKASVSIALMRVKDPSQFGLVHTTRQGRITRFVEKPSPSEVTASRVNAGAYIFEEDALDAIDPGKVLSLERDVFPMLLAQGRKLQAFVTHGYWLDIGTLDKYLQAHIDILHEKVRLPMNGLRTVGRFLLGSGVRLGTGVTVPHNGRICIGAGSMIGDHVRFSAAAAIGEDCDIGEGAVLGRCVVLSGTSIGVGAVIKDCIVGNNCRIGPGTKVASGTTLGDGTVLVRGSR